MLTGTGGWKGHAIAIPVYIAIAVYITIAVYRLPGNHIEDAWKACQ